MNLEDLARLAAEGYNRVALSKEVFADLETPLSAYLKLAHGPYTCLFESVQGGEKWGRYSIIGLKAHTVLKVWGHRAIVECDGEVVEEHSELADPLAFVEAFQRRYRVPAAADLPLFHGGLVGYFGYDIVRYVEPSLADTCPPDPLGNPDILLMVSEEVLVFDNLAGTMRLVVHCDPGVASSVAAARLRLEALAERLLQPLPELPPLSPEPGDLPESAFESEFGEQRYHQAVERIRAYTRAGEVQQVVPSQRLSLAFDGEPLNLYRALRHLNPSPYLYYLHLGDFHVVGSSPEILARAEAGQVTVRPIAGTRRRGHDAAEDQALEAELLADPKERAEHLMLIDLGCEDAARVARPGTVRVTEKMAIERYAYVMHMVSNVVGELREGVTSIDVLKATLPAGTLSGAPKRRAMEIIDELETVKRGIYGGAVGYIGWQDNMDMAIAIRTAVIQRGRLHVQAGGGVVADSVPRLEWQETMNKARAMFRAASMAMAQGSKRQG